MRAIRYDDDAVFLDPDAPDPTPGAGEAVIRPTRVGIASSDLAICQGEIPFRGVIGHQFVGVVMHVEPGAARDRQDLVGKRVVGSINLPCGRCEMCRGGLSNHCPHRKILGLLDRDGCLAERFTLPVANLQPVPDTITDDQAVFAEPLASVVHASQLIRIETKPYVTILGDNASALLSAQVMARMNASVRVLGTNPQRLSLCDKWGVKHRHASDVGRRQDQDVVIDCTSTRESVELAMQLVRPRGKIVLRAEPLPVPGQVCRDDRAVDLTPAILNELELVGARCGHIDAALATIARGEIDLLSLITRRARLDDGVGALRAAMETDQIKVVVEP